MSVANGPSPRPRTAGSCFPNVGERDMTNPRPYAKRRRLSAEEKWGIYQQCQQPDASIGEILRAHGLYASDLQKIRRAVESGALDALRQSRPGRKKQTSVPKEDYDRLHAELREKEQALAEMTVLFTVLKKKVNLE